MIKTVRELKEFVLSIPENRDGDLVAIYDVSGGERFNLRNLDLLVDGTVDINIDLTQWEEG